MEVAHRSNETDRPQAAFRTISEEADELDLPQHVLRFWETRFSQIRPLKRGGGRRYYRSEDVDLLRGIKHLLYGQGYTIKGVQRILKAQGVKFVQNVWSDPGSLKAAGETGPRPGDLDEAAVAPPSQQMAEGGIAGRIDMPAMQTVNAEAIGQPGFLDRPGTASLKLSEQSRLRLLSALSDLQEARQLLAHPSRRSAHALSADDDG